MKTLLIITFLFIGNHALYAQVEIPTKETSLPKKKITAKQRLNCNMTIKYKKRPKPVETFGEIFTKGIFYGRFRTNTFIFDAGAEGEDHHSTGIGGSLIYKTAPYEGFSFTTALYTSQSPNSIKKEELGNYRSGKDTFSRYAVATKGDTGLTSLAQTYLSYKKHRVEVRLGRFLMETLMLKSHDTKMIPVAFEGVDLKISTIPKTKIEFAYLTKEKLRDHEDFHGVLSYNDDTTSPYAKWSGNDDGSMHRGITTSKLREKGIEDRLWVFEAQNRSFKDTQIRLGYTASPQLLSSLILETSHKFTFENGVKVKPAIRYMQQFDDGAGEIGGANIKNDTTGYSNPDSLATNMIASRVDFMFGDASLRVGYSKVADKGDIVAPWHAQPTAGYSRPMSGKNWYANTETVMLRADYDFPEKSLLEGVHLMSRYAIYNFDDEKSGVSSDSNAFTFDIVKRFPDNPNLFLKVRSIILTQDHQVTNLDGSYKKDPSYKELRLELDYLF